MENKENKLGEEPAFPIVDNGQLCSIEFGMSKRFYAACMVLQGLLSNPTIISSTTESCIVKDAYSLADELLKQEEE